MCSIIITLEVLYLLYYPDIHAGRTLLSVDPEIHHVCVIQNEKNTGTSGDDNHEFPRCARNAPISLPLLLPPPRPALGNPDDAPPSAGYPSNSCSGADSESGL